MTLVACQVVPLLALRSSTQALPGTQPLLVNNVSTLESFTDPKHPAASRHGDGHSPFPPCTPLKSELAKSRRRVSVQHACSKLQPQVSSAGISHLMKQVAWFQKWITPRPCKRLYANRPGPSPGPEGRTLAPLPPPRSPRWWGSPRCRSACRAPRRR